MLGDKFRFRFVKSGTLRLVSHHDLMRCSERMLRRAAVPFKSTAGFHPTPRWVFALSLSLGVVGCDEVVELELTEPRDSDELLACLNAQAPTGLKFTSVKPVPMKATATPRRVVYEMPLPVDRVTEVEAAATALMAEPKVWVERLKPSPKRLNIRPYFRCVSVERQPTPLAPLPEGKGEFSTGAPLAIDAPSNSSSPVPSGRGASGVGLPILRLDLWVTQTGSARADELLKLLYIEDLIDTGAVLERTVVEIRDEYTGTDPGDAPPDGHADSIPLSGAEVAALSARLDEESNQQPIETGWGASPNGPVVE